MKKYFAKYLPVEGKIEEGDYFIELDNTGQTCILKYDSPTSLFPHDHLVSRKKAKLFLCSRDIQVGDKIYYKPSNKALNPPEEGFHNVIKTTQYTVSFKKGTVAKELCFKVIGEIPPAAAWVKEGDEFDEDDISTSSYCDRYNCKCDGSCSNCSGEIEQRLSIMCPTCKTFH